MYAGVGELNGLLRRACMRTWTAIACLDVYARVVERNCIIMCYNILGCFYALWGLWGLRGCQKAAGVDVGVQGSPKDTRSTTCFLRISVCANFDYPSQPSSTVLEFFPACDIFWGKRSDCVNICSNQGSWDVFHTLYSANALSWAQQNCDGQTPLSVVKLVHKNLKGP